MDGAGRSPGARRLHSEYRLLFTAFVGLNLFQSALTGRCFMDDILKALGVGGPTPGAPRPTAGAG